MKNARPLLLTFGVLALAACQSLFDSTPRPDYAVRVTPTEHGGLAIAPSCPGWDSATANPLDNQPVPQFGCANARNLAAMIETPNDLLQGRDLGPARGTVIFGSLRRYDNNQPRGLIMPGSETDQAAATTAATNASQMTGELTSNNGTTMPVAPTSVGSP